MASVNFLYRSTKNNAPLNVRLLFRHNSKDYTFGAKSKLYIYTYDELQQNNKLDASKYWNELHTAKSSRNIDLGNKQHDINTAIKKIENFVLNEFDNTPVDEVINNKHWLKEVLDTYYNPPKSNPDIPRKLIPFFDYYISKKENELNINRVRNINVTKHKLQKLEVQLKKQFKITDFNEDFKDLFTSYCRDNQYAENTQQRELTLIKTVCRYASYLGLETHPQMDSIKLPRKETNHIHLTETELKTIGEINLPHEHLENARDWLVISCYVGQRVSDFMRFDSSMIRTENGKQLLEFKQVKTKKLMTIPVSKEVQAVLAKRNGEFPRAISDQKYNDYIKVVCQLAELNEMCEGKKRISIAPEGVKPTKSDYRDVVGTFKKWQLVSSHIGRRSFATNFYSRVPTSLLINITGHSSEKMFLNYISKSNKDLALESYDYFN
jgi:site-specific recombinase XerD